MAFYQLYDDSGLFGAVVRTGNSWLGGNGFKPHRRPCFGEIFQASASFYPNGVCYGAKWKDC